MRRLMSEATGKGIFGGCFFSSSQGAVQRLFEENGERGEKVFNISCFCVDDRRQYIYRLRNFHILFALFHSCTAHPSTLRENEWHTASQSTMSQSSNHWKECISALHHRTHYLCPGSPGEYPRMYCVCPGFMGEYSMMKETNFHKNNPTLV